jgi:hypothetical protein
MIVDDKIFTTIIQSLEERIDAIKEAEKKYIEIESKENFNDYLMNFFESKSSLFDWEKEILPKLNEEFPNILRLIFQNLSIEDEILKKFKNLSANEKQILIKNLEVTTLVMKINNDINKRAKVFNSEEEKVYLSFENAIKILNENLSL